MIFNRIQGGSNDGIDTHKSKYYQRIFNKYRKFLRGDSLIIDPFAKDCEWADITNDINPNTKAKHNLDALEFLKNIESNIAGLILFDPPFSDIQNERKYGSSNLYASDSNKISLIQNEFSRILKPGGYVIKLGYNSTKIKNLEIIETMIINFGGSRNDVIVTVQKKCDQNLQRWLNK